MGKVKKGKKKPIPKVEAYTDITIDLECPHCGDFQDRYKDLVDYLPNDENCVENISCVLECDSCEKEFEVTDINF